MYMSFGAKTLQSIYKAKVFSKGEGMKNLRKHLFSLADEDYKNFSIKLLPENTNMIGVRLPQLRKTAKTMVKNGLGSELLSFIYDYECEYFEETMLKGMAIGAVKCGLEEKLKLIRHFVLYIDNWSVCDSFCSSLKFDKAELPKVWDLIKEYTESSEEFFARFGYVSIIRFFINEEYIDRVFERFEALKSPELYARLAVAWAISMCFPDFEERTLEYIRASTLDDFTLKKAVGKIKESYRVSSEGKQRAVKALAERKK